MLHSPPPEFESVCLPIGRWALGNVSYSSAHVPAMDFERGIFDEEMKQRA